MSEFQPSRRAVTRGTAWAIPVVAVATQAPAYAASCAPFRAPVNTSGKVQGPGTIVGGYACWGPGEGSGSDGCTGSSEPRRYWVNSDGFQGTVSCANFNVWQATQAFSSTITNGDLGPRTYTFTGSVMTNYGNHNYSTAYGAGVALQTSTNGTTWTTQIVYVTRDGADTNPMPPSSYTGCTWATGFTNIAQLAPTPQTACTTAARFANATYNFSVTVPSGVTTLYFRRLFFVAPRTAATLCSGVATASDDVSVSDATIRCA